MPPTPPPLPAVPVLNYAGPTVPERPAFNARRTWTWKGEHLFRVYLTTTHAWFIRIGGAKNNAAAYQFGLLGAIIALWMSKTAKKRAKKKVLEYEEKPLDQLLAGHKRNHVIALADMSDPAIETAGFWGGGAIKWTFQESGQKKRTNCVLEDTDDVDAAIQCLAALFPNLRIAVQYDERKKKYVKLK